MRIRYAGRKHEQGYYRVFSNMGKLVGLFRERASAVEFAKTRKHNQLVELSDVFIDDKEILMASFADTSLAFDFKMVEVIERINREQHLSSGNLGALQ